MKNVKFKKNFFVEKYMCLQQRVTSWESYRLLKHMKIKDESEVEADLGRA